MINFSAAVNPIQVGGGNQTGDVIYPKDGDSYFTVVALPGSESASDVFQNLDSYNKFNADKPIQKRAAIMVIMFGATNAAKFPENFASRVLPLILPPTVGAELFNAFSDDDLGYTPTYMNEDGTIQTKGVIFKMIRDAKATPANMYRIQAIPATASRYKDFDNVTTYGLPEMSLTAFAETYTENAHKLAQDNAPAGEDKAPF